MTLNCIRKYASDDRINLEMVLNREQDYKEHVKTLYNIQQEIDDLLCGFGYWFTDEEQEYLRDVRQRFKAMHEEKYQDYHQYRYEMIALLRGIKPLEEKE